MFGEQPSASKWNILGTNDASFNDGTGIGNDVIDASKMIYGMVRNRQGSTTGDNSWASSGSNNTDTSSKNVFIQVGSIGSSAAGAVTVTFPTAYTYAPIVLLSAERGAGIAIPVLESTPSTTTASVSCWVSDTPARIAVTVRWIAIGQ